MEFFLVRNFPHSDWIRRDTPYPSVLSTNAGKYESKKTSVFGHFSCSDILAIRNTDHFFNTCSCRVKVFEIVHNYSWIESKFAFCFKKLSEVFSDYLVGVLWKCIQRNPIRQQFPLNSFTAGVLVLAKFIRKIR